MCWLGDNACTGRVRVEKLTVEGEVDGGEEEPEDGGNEEPRKLGHGVVIPGGVADYGF